MSAIADFSELVLAVGEHINRTDLVDVIPRFVRMAELKLDRELRLRDQEASDDLTTDADGEVALPTDFLEVRSIYVTGSPPIIIPALSEDNSIMEYTAGTARGFIINGDTLRIRPAAVATVRLNYFSSIPALETSTNQVNWLLTKYPDIYLYTTIFEAAVYTGDTDRAGAADGLARAAIASAMRYSKLSKLSRARVRVGGLCP
jgi:hypothetical protein